MLREVCASRTAGREQVVATDVEWTRIDSGLLDGINGVRRKDVEAERNEIQK